MEIEKKNQKIINKGIDKKVVNKKLFNLVEVLKKIINALCIKLQLKGFLIE